MECTNGGGGGTESGGERKEEEVCFIHSPDLLLSFDRNPRYTGRAELVYTLIEAYGLLHHMRVVCPEKATGRQLQGFHSNEYIHFLETHSNQSDSSDDEEAAEEFGLGYDCPLFTGCYDYVCDVGGAGLTSADLLLSGDVKIVLNWYGGWHHAKRDGASGYCYCNDIVLTVLRLQTYFNRILYIDIDIHHGDGVEEAFWFSRNVMNISFHHFSPGFFPGTGGVSDVGGGRGKYYTINVPLFEGVGDQQYIRLFREVMKTVRERFQPQCLVVQCGADLLSGDPLGVFNLTVNGVAQCLEFILHWNLPTILLGGGGYNFPNTARLWAVCTALAVGQHLHDNIPDHQYFTKYGPDYQLHMTPGLRQDRNSQEYITNLTDNITKNFHYYNC